MTVTAKPCSGVKNKSGNAIDRNPVTLVARMKIRTARSVWRTWNREKLERAKWNGVGVKPESSEVSVPFLLFQTIGTINFHSTSIR
jgi:hypothetical protein